MSTTVEDKEFRRRLRLIMQQFGSVADLARAVGVSDNAIYKWVSGRGQPGMISLVNLAKAAGVSVEWLATGRGLPAKSKSAEVAAPAELPGFVAMPRVALRGAGGRLTTQSQQLVDYLNFRPEWLQRVLGVDPRSLALVEAVGDSMSPTIDDGDLVLVDLREPRFNFDAIYVFKAGGDLSVKRVQRQQDGSLIVRSDNPAYAPQPAEPDGLDILGRVIWIGGRP